jgi:ubiquinone/menaquinone biosynthesis C-methylase UbiE
MAPLETLYKSDVEIDPWEAAYLRFETPEEEIKKFARRLKQMGATGWPRHAEIVELFSGRGNGLRALEQLGFDNITGVDLSKSLLAEYSGTARCYACDCRNLPFENASKDILIIQGGLHHLCVLPDDLIKCLGEAYRVLRAEGQVIIVEPWMTPFLSLVHWTCGQKIARRLFPRIDALATMIEHEYGTYRQWLSQGPLVLEALSRFFDYERCQIRCGKLRFRGRKRLNVSSFLS